MAKYSNRVPICVVLTPTNVYNLYSLLHLSFPLLILLAHPRNSLTPTTFLGVPAKTVVFFSSTVISKVPFKFAYMLPWQKDMILSLSSVV